MRRAAIRLRMSCDMSNRTEEVWKSFDQANIHSCAQEVHSYTADSRQPHISAHCRVTNAFAICVKSSIFPPLLLRHLTSSLAHANRRPIAPKITHRTLQKINAKKSLFRSTNRIKKFQIPIYYHQQLNKCLKVLPHRIQRKKIFDKLY